MLRNHFRHRAQRALRAQHLMTSCPTPSSNRGRHVRSAGYPISHAPAESRSAGCGARRKAVHLSGRRHGVAPWASVKLPLRPACPSKARACPWWSTSWAKVRQAQAYPRAFPSREAQAQAYPEASQPNPRPAFPSKARACPWWSTSWAKARQAQAYPRAFPSREAQAREYPEASQPSPQPRNPSKARACPWWSTSWAKARQAQAYPRAFPSREAQARGCPEASQPSPRPRNPSKARVLPA